MSVGDFDFDWDIDLNPAFDAFQPHGRHNRGRAALQRPVKNPRSERALAPKPQFAQLGGTGRSRLRRATSSSDRKFAPAPCHRPARQCGVDAKNRPDLCDANPLYPNNLQPRSGNFSIQISRPQTWKV